MLSAGKRGGDLPPSVASRTYHHQLLLPRPSQDTDIHSSTTTKQHTLTVILPNDLLQLLLAQARLGVHFMATGPELLRADFVCGVAQENLGQPRLFRRVVGGVGMCM